LKVRANAHGIMDAVRNHLKKEHRAVWQDNLHRESTVEVLGYLCKKKGSNRSEDEATRTIFSQRISRLHRRMDMLVNQIPVYGG